MKMRTGHLFKRQTKNALDHLRPFLSQQTTLHDGHIYSYDSEVDDDMYPVMLEERRLAKEEYAACLANAEIK